MDIHENRNDRLANLESQMNNSLMEVLRQHPDSLSGRSPEEMAEVAIPEALKDEKFLEALAISMALRWWQAESATSSVVNFFEDAESWQQIHLCKAGWITTVASPEDIRTNTSCVGFQAEKATPDLIAAVEELRVGELSILPALLVPHLCRFPITRRT